MEKEFQEWAFKGVQEFILRNKVLATALKRLPEKTTEFTVNDYFNAAQIKL